MSINQQQQTAELRSLEAAQSRDMERSDLSKQVAVERERVERLEADVIQLIARQEADAELIEQLSSKIVAEIGTSEALRSERDADKERIAALEAEVALANESADCCLTLHDDLGRVIAERDSALSRAERAEGALRDIVTAWDRPHEPLNLKQMHSAIVAVRSLLQPQEPEASR